MDDSVGTDQTAAATAYETLHVPAIFEEWTGPVLDAACVEAGHRVLDVACGTGVLARAAVERVGRDGSVCGVDPDPGMLAVARQLAPAVDYRSGTAEDLPFGDAEFDAVVSQFGMMFFVDTPGAIREILRVLKPGSRLAVAVWDGLENQPAYSIEVDLLQRRAGQAAADALRAPFGLGDAAALEEVFRSAGVGEPTVETSTGTARFPSVRAMVEADLRGWLPLMGVELPEDLIAEILAEAEAELARFVEESGEVVFDSPAHIVSGLKEGR